MTVNDADRESLFACIHKLTHQSFSLSKLLQTGKLSVPSINTFAKLYKASSLLQLAELNKYNPK